MSNNYPTAIIPFADLSPAACSALATAIEDALDIFRKWRIKLDLSRLVQAQKTLQHIVAQNSYGQSPEEMFIAAKAIRLASDFYHTSRILQSEPAEPMAHELKIALQGTLQGNTANQSPYDYQSQFWVGSLLAYSRLHPTVIPRSGRAPDFTVTIDTLRCNVEVKRPQNRTSAFKTMLAAAAQLNEAGIPGIIAIDLSTAIDVDQFVNADVKSKPRDIVRHLFFELADELSTTAHNYTRSDKFNHTIGMILFARFFVWTLGESKDADNGFFFSMPILTRAYSGLLIDQTLRIHKKITDGLERLSGNPLAMRYHQ